MRRRHHAGARHRRQQRDLRAGRRDAASPAAVSRARSPGDDLGTQRDVAREAASRRSTCSTGTSAAARSRRSAASCPSVGGMVMAGARRHRGNGSAAMGHRGHLRRARRQADCRPHVPSVRRQSERARCVVLSEAFWRTRFDARSRSRRPRDPARRDRRAPSSASCPKEFQLLGRTSIWAMRADSHRRPARAGRASLQVVRPAEAGRHARRRRADRSAAVADGLAREFPETNKGRGVRLEPLHDALIGSELAPHLDAVPRRRRLRAADLLRERRQPAAGARHRADARAGGPLRARRRPAARRSGSS